MPLVGIGVNVVLLVRPGRHRETAQNTAVVQVTGPDLTGYGVAAGRTDRHRRRHRLERQSQRLVEVENPKVTHPGLARTDQQPAGREVDGDLLVVLPVLVEEECFACIAGFQECTRHEFHTRHRPVVAVFTAAVDRSVAVEPDIGLAVGSLLGDDLRAVAEILEGHIFGPGILPRPGSPADDDRSPVGTDLRIVDFAAVGQIEALHDTARGIQHHILAVNDIVGQGCPERRRRVERRLLQRSYGTTRRIAAVTGRDDRRAEGAERHQPGLIDRSDTLVRGSPPDRRLGIGRTGRGDQPETFPDG